VRLGGEFSKDFLIFASSSFANKVEAQELGWAGAKIEKRLRPTLRYTLWQARSQRVASTLVASVTEGNNLTTYKSNARHTF
jgi:hypothetical protein